MTWYQKILKPDQIVKNIHEIDFEARKRKGINALIMDTYKGLELGKEFTSGKECFPCQVTLGDILRTVSEPTLISVE